MTVRLQVYLSGLALLVWVCLTAAQQPAPPVPLPAIQPDQARLSHVLGGLDGPGFALAYSEKHGILVAACEQRSLHYWARPAILGVRAGDSTPHVLQEHTAPVTALAWAGGPIMASAGTDKKIVLWAMPEGMVKATLSDHTGAVRALAMSPDGKLLASAGDDPAIYLWDLSAGKVLRKLEGHTDWVMALAFSPDGKLLASAGYDQVIRIWDVATPGKPREIPAKPAMPPGLVNHVLALTFSPDGKLLAAGGTDTQVRLFNLADGKELRAIAGHGSSVTALAFHPTGNVLISGSKDRTVRVWNPANGQPFKPPLEGHQSWVQGLVLVDRGSMVASVGADQSVRVWDLKPPPK